MKIINEKEWVRNHIVVLARMNGEVREVPILFETVQAAERHAAVVAKLLGWSAVAVRERGEVTVAREFTVETPALRN